MTRRQKRTPIDPKTLKKHSDVARQHANHVEVSGERQQTDTGFRVPGTSCRNYETFYEWLAEGQATATVVHAKKYRSYRVLEGQGLALIRKNGETKQVTLLPGDEITMAPGIEYQLCSMPTLTLELLVTQAYKYEASLKVVEESPTKAVLKPEQLKPVSRAEAIEKNLVAMNGGIPPRRPRHLQKAAQQQSQQARARGKLVGMPEGRPTTSPEAPVQNVKPTMGALDPSGHG